MGLPMTIPLEISPLLLPEKTVPTDPLDDHIHERIAHLPV
jgi:hypothetical protein